MANWLDVIQILLLVGACWACFNAGKIKGITEIIETMLYKRMITMEDLKKLEK